jgi:hypothetical protein
VLCQRVPNDQTVWLAQTILSLYRQDSMTEREAREGSRMPRRVSREVDSDRSSLQEWTQQVDALLAEVNRGEERSDV